jgi:hypothetical protein
MRVTSRVPVFRRGGRVSRAVCWGWDFFEICDRGSRVGSPHRGRGVTRRRVENNGALNRLTYMNAFVFGGGDAA